MSGAKAERARPPRDGVRSGVRHWGRALVTGALDLLAFKPIALFVGWLSGWANRVHFERRRGLRRRIAAALAAGRPVVVASNHVSWFDDPVIPMALHRSGARAALELGGLAVWLALCAALPGEPLARTAAAGVGVWAVARFGVRKTWWTLGALENLSDASVLRGKLALVRRAPPGPLLRALLAVADRAIRGFMRSDTVRTLFVDRRPGEEARRHRARALGRALEVAARPACVWVFFEGGRSKVPGTIAPARRGVGALVLGLRERGHDPLVIALSHRGMERVIPPGAPRFLSTGHDVSVRWAELDARIREAARDGEQAVADAVRAAVVALQAPAAPEPPRPRTAARTLARVAGTAAGWLAFGALVLVWGVLVVPAALLLSPGWPGVRERFARLTRAALAAFVRGLPFLRFRVERDAPALPGARILVVNHQSRLDSPLLMAIEPRLAGPVRGYMLRVPVVGAVIRLLGFFDADAGEAASFDAMNRAAERARSRGEGLLFYPEGTRSRDGEIGAFRRGAFRAAVDHDLPIQPVVIEGIEAVFPPGRAIAARVRSSMAEALAKMRAERSPPQDGPRPAGGSSGWPLPAGPCNTLPRPGGSRAPRELPNRARNPR